MTASLPPQDSGDIDRKGRSQPIYERRSAEPWRPSRAFLLALGLWPGARIMATGRGQRGLPYAVLGLGMLVALVWLVAAFPQSKATLERINARPAFLVLHAFAVLALITMYELLRFGSVCEETRRASSRTPRLLAAFVLPAALVLVFGPQLMSYGPRYVEAAWFASGILLLGAFPAAVWCIFEAALLTAERQRRFRQVCAAVFAVGAALVVLLLVTGAGASWEPDLRAAGFVVLPRLLAG